MLGRNDAEDLIYKGMQDSVLRQRRAASVQGKAEMHRSPAALGAHARVRGAASIYTLCFLTQKQRFYPLTLAPQPGW